MELVFLKLCSFVVNKYVCGEMDQIVLVGKRESLDGEDQSFAREAEGFLFSLCLNARQPSKVLK